MAASRLSLHRQQALGKGLDGELARLGHLFLGAAAGVLGLGLGAQVGVGHLGVLGLELGQLRSARYGLHVGARRPAAPVDGPALRLVAGSVVSRAWDGVFAVIAEDVRRNPAASRGTLRFRPNAQAGAAQSVVDRGAPAVPVGELRAGRAWSGGPARCPAAGSGARRRAAAAALARGDALGGLLVQRLRDRRRPAHALSRRPTTVRVDARPGASSSGRRAQLARRLGRLAVDLHPALADLLGGSARVLKKRAAHSHLSRRTPLLTSDRLHRAIVGKPACRRCGLGACACIRTFP